MPAKKKRKTKTETKTETKIFISWSGDTSNRVATAFRKVFKIHYRINAFHSVELKNGEEWLEQLKKAIKEECKFAFIFLTPKSIESAWVLWESGALWGRECRIFPVLIGIESKDIPEPIKVLQIQATCFLPKTEKESDEKFESRLEADCSKIFAGVNLQLEKMKIGGTYKERDFLSTVWSVIRTELLGALETVKSEISNAWEIINLKKEITSLVDRINIISTSVWSPVYLMDEKYNIDYMNITAKIVFGVDFNDREKLSYAQFFAEVKDKVENFKSIEENFNDKFVNNSKPPLRDFEEIQYNHPIYGKILMQKAGIAILGPAPENKRIGWVVTFNIQYVERKEEFYRYLEPVIIGHILDKQRSLVPKKP
ncbi:MAG: toll/interleukin-1 receptor domain-containing protein [Planctomycetes bacterium]|nr:toll/interleukin-1 receptor domain-containing protein [Planctomycetota bacterium]